MHAADIGRLQIYEVEARNSNSATCIVRCIGGIPRVGQKFTAESITDSSTATSSITLDSIIRYNKEMTFIDPPHNARVHLSGEGVVVLEKGVIIALAETGEAC